MREHTMKIARRRRRFLGVFITSVLLVSSTSSAAPTRKKAKDLNVLGMFPFTGTWHGGRAFMKAAVMALEQVNAREDLLPEHTINLIYNDSKCDAGWSTHVMHEMLHEPPVKIAMLGGTCSPVTAATASASHYWNINQVSTGSSSPLLSNKLIYPKLFRVGGSENTYNPAKVLFAKMFGWERVATLQESVSVFSTTTDDLVELFVAENMTLLTREIFTGDPAPQIKNLKERDARIIFTLFYPGRSHSVLCEAYKAGLHGPRYVWVFVGWMEDVGYDATRDDGCTYENLAAVADGALYFTRSYVTHKPQMGVSGFTARQLMEMYEQRTADETDLYARTHVSVAYDAVWLLALGLNETYHALRQRNATSRRLEEFTYDDADMSAALQLGLRGVHFLGMKGDVAFGKEQVTADEVEISQLQLLNGGKKVVGFYIPPDQVGQPGQLILDGATLQWRGGSPPHDRSVLVIHLDAVDSRVYVVAACLSTAGIILATTFLAYNVKYRESRIIKISAPNLNNVILMGCIIIYSTIFCDFTSVRDKLKSAICRLQIYALVIGISLSLSALFFKTWRVHYIFSNRKLQHRVIKDRRLIAGVMITVLVNAIVLSFWEGLDPLQIHIYNHTIVNNGIDEDILYQTQRCESTYESYFNSILYVIQGLLLAFGSFIAWETRKVKREEFNDSRQIAMCIYNAVVLGIVGVTIGVILADQATTGFIVQSSCLIVATSTTQIIIFAPKIAQHRKSGTATAPQPVATTSVQPSTSFAQNTQPTNVLPIHRQHDMIAKLTVTKELLAKAEKREASLQATVAQLTAENTKLMTKLKDHGISQYSSI